MYMSFSINLFINNEGTSNECLILNAKDKNTKIMYHKRISAKIIDKIYEFKNFVVNIKTLYKLLNLIIIHEKHKIELQEKNSLKISFKISSLNKILSIKLIPPKKPILPSKSKKNYSKLNVNNRKLILPPISSNTISCMIPKLFLSHSWDTDSLNRDNHKRVKRLNHLLLKTHKVETWFDDNMLRGNIPLTICNAIDSSNVLLICITQQYINKCNMDSDNYCKMEFNYIQARKGSQKIIPIVMEDICLDTKKWKGPIGAYLNSKLYIPITQEINNKSIEKIVTEAYRLTHN